MPHSRILVLLPLFAVLGLALGQPGTDSRTNAVAQWVWFDEGDPRSNAPAGSRYFRHVFTLPAAPVGEAVLEITADNHFTAYLNGTKVGSGDAWETLFRFRVEKHLGAGKNVLAVEGRNDGGPAGLVARLTYATKQGKTSVVTNAVWKSAETQADGWQKLDFDDAKWGKVQVLGPFGKTGPWTTSGAAPKPRGFNVPPGYKVVEAVKRPEDRGPFSIVNMTFDRKGRLFLAQEGGPILICTQPNKEGVWQGVADYCSQIKNCHGMCWVEDDLFLVGNGPKGTGLYRCRDTKGRDAIDQVTLLHSFNGGMGEHGPHAVLYGPDRKLYVVLGNHAFARIGPKLSPNPESLASNSPLTRWPTGGQGPDQGKPGSTEDVLLPRLDDANGHAAGIRAPGGTIWRMDLDGKNVALVSAGFRNQFDAAFNPDGELFSFDSDMEWDEGLPWYRAVRAIHCPPGADFVWRTGAANTPNYYLDSLPPLIETGRGSPVGVTFCQNSRFGEKYQGAFFMADWSIGVIYAVHLKRKGATYDAALERFCTGSPMNVTDLEFAPDGSLCFTTGGRGSQGGVYRIVPPQEDRANSTGSDEAVARARAVWELGLAPGKGKNAQVEQALGDADALVRRRACEALIRLGAEPDLKNLWPLLNDDDHHVNTAARLVLQRIDPKKWLDRLAHEKTTDRAAWHAIIALCNAGKASDHARAIFARLQVGKPESDKALLDHIRTQQLACFHIRDLPDDAKALAASSEKLFPHQNKFVSRELAILLTHYRRAGATASPIHARLLSAIAASKGDRPQQIHYFYCLRLLAKDWTTEEKAALANWYEDTRDWRGGASFGGFLRNIFTECLAAYSPSERLALLSSARPHVATVIARRVPQEKRDLSLVPTLREMLPKSEKNAELRQALVEAALYTVREKPLAEHFDVMVPALSSSNKANVLEAITQLKKIEARPKDEDAKAYRALLLAASKMDEKQRWKAVELLRHWSKGRRFGAADGEWKKELTAWSRWYGQAFPKEPKLPDVVSDKPGPSKYAYADLLAFVTKGEGKIGNAQNGKLVFEKAQCAKCHRYGKDGDALGPDLTTLAQRFKRADVLEAIYYPSKVISDQYRSTQVVTKQGLQFTGLLAAQGDMLTILQSDGTKVNLRKQDVEEQFASLVSVMPEKLLDPLSKQEIADLFAYLESPAAR